MGGVRSGVVGVVLASVCIGVGFVGCAAAGEVDPLIDTGGNAPEPTAQLPGPSAPAPTSSEDAGKPAKDAGTKDSAVDAGPPPPVPGAPCTTIDEVRKRACGACGTQATICLSAGDPDAGAGTWQEYGPCEGELAGGCIPGTKVTEACGNCGTLTKTCSAYCAFTTSACTGQPASSCVPGNVDLSTASCGVPNTFRQRTCQASCTYNSFGSECMAPPTTIEVGPTTGSVTSTIAVLTADAVLSRPTGTCPNATLSTTVSTPYTWLRVHNPLAKEAQVAIYNTVAPGGVVFKTLLAAYAGAGTPSGDAERKACTKGVATIGTAALTGDSKLASLDGTRAVTIAPGATVTVYVAAYNAYDATKPTESTGKVKLNVQTLQVAP